MPFAEVSFFKVKKSDKFHPKTTLSRSQLMQGLDTNIHCLAEEFSEWIPLFVKPLKVILSKRFVTIKQSQTFKRKYDKQFKYIYIAVPRGGARGGRGLQPPSGNLSPPVGEN